MICAVVFLFFTAGGMELVDTLESGGYAMLKTA
jgi:hypothetical protein